MEKVYEKTLLIVVNYHNSISNEDLKKEENIENVKCLHIRKKCDHPRTVCIENKQKIERKNI